MESLGVKVLLDLPVYLVSKVLVGPEDPKEDVVHLGLQACQDLKDKKAELELMDLLVLQEFLGLLDLQVTEELLVYLDLLGQLVQEELLDHKENEVILVALEKKDQLVLRVCLVHLVHLVQEENVVKKVHLENLEHLVLEDDLEIKVRLVLLGLWVLLGVLDCQ